MSLWNNRKFTPMLLKEVEKPFNSENHIYEIKFDGIRALIYANPKEVKVISRRHQDLTHLYPELQKIKNIVKKNTIFDGEIVAFNEGKPSFQKLQLRSHLKSKEKIEFQAKKSPIIFMAFDILYENKELINLSLMDRKKILKKYKNNSVFSKTFYIENNGIELFNEIKKNDLEGVIAKKKNSIYLINKRSENWIKIKNLKTEKFIVGGFIEKSESNTISLILGEIINKKLYYVGNVVLGKRREFYKKIKNTLLIQNPPFIDLDDKKVTYIKPINICYVKYLERTKSNHLRQPVFVK